MLEDAINWVELYFPNLRGKHSIDYEITSQSTPNYNCIAWAAGDTERWWWPSLYSYWPQELPRMETIANFIAAFERLGYQVTVNAGLEPNYEKVALYAKDSVPTHMARQLTSGDWTSKLGRGVDIKHKTLNGVECDEYGQVVQILRRQRN